MANIGLSYSKYTTEYYERLKRNIPAYYLLMDTSGNFDKFLMAISEALAKVRLGIENLSYRNDFDRTQREQLKNIANNFGLYIIDEYVWKELNKDLDKNFWDSQRAFVGLASRWINRKATDIGFKALISSYGRNSEINELAVYFPYCGDIGTSPLLCGETSPEIYCGEEAVLPDSHHLYDLANALSVIQVKLENYDPNDPINSVLLKMLEFLKPIHVRFADPPFISL